jgi:glycosyltransferase 2 family protein
VKRIVQAIVGLAVSGLALWLTLRGKDLGGVWLAMREADYRYLWLYLPFLVAIHLVRTVRWGILLEPVAKVPFARLNAASAVGFMALAILPFRLGEFARPYLVAERPRIRVSAALSSVVVERVADGIFTGLLLVAALLFVPDGTPGVRVLRTAGVVVSLSSPPTGTARARCRSCRGSSRRSRRSSRRARAACSTRSSTASASCRRAARWPCSSCSPPATGP